MGYSDDWDGTPFDPMDYASEQLLASDASDRDDTTLFKMVVYLSNRDYSLAGADGDYFKEIALEAGYSAERVDAAVAWYARKQEQEYSAGRSW